MIKTCIIKLLEAFAKMKVAKKDSHLSVKSDFEQMFHKMEIAREGNAIEQLARIKTMRNVIGL